MSLRLIAAAVLLTGCGTPVVPQEAQSVRDFVVVTDLQQIERIRLYQLHYTYVNDYFVGASSGSGRYLVEFDSRCRALRSKDFTPAMVDSRFNSSYLSEGDTIRGCPIEGIYEATAEQLMEMKALK
jgi:hypothetical protein